MVEDAGLRAELASLLPELRGFARFLVRDVTEADDLVQDAVLRALGALHQFRPGTSLRAWLFTILRNRHYEQARRRRRERHALAALPETADQAPRQEGQAAVGQLYRLLWTLSPRLREAVVLVGARGLAYEEAAAICNVPVGTMKARVARARAALAGATAGDRKIAKSIAKS